MIFCPDRPRSTGQNSDTEPSASQQGGRLRPWVIALFAIVLLARSGFAQTLQWDGATGYPPNAGGSFQAQDHGNQPIHSAEPNPPVANSPVAKIPMAKVPVTKPVLVELYAGLANLDRDASADGWRAEIIIRDRNDRITTPRGHARFELRDRWADPSVPSPIRWSVPLRYDPDGIARIRLPMRGDDARHLSTVSHASQGIGTGRFRQRSVVPVAIRGDFFDSRWVAAPSVGRLWVTVSVPGQGTFKASADVIARPAMPVDLGDRSRRRRN